MSPFPRRIRVEYEFSTCIGNQACVKADPKTFHFDLTTKSAVLVGGKPSGAWMVVEKSGDAAAIAKAIHAASQCPVNAFRVLDADTNAVLVGNTISADQAKVIHARYDDAKEFVLDPQGYFLIRVNDDKKTIEAGFCNSKNRVVLTVIGAKPIDVYHTIARNPDLKLRSEHYAYLGRELEKAYHCLMTGMEYVQDDELHAMKPKKR